MRAWLWMAVGVVGCTSETGFRDVPQPVEVPAVVPAEPTPEVRQVSVDHLLFQCHVAPTAFGTLSGTSTFSFPPDQRLTEFLRIGVALDEPPERPVLATVYLESREREETWTFRLDLQEGLFIVDAAGERGVAYAEWDKALGDVHPLYQGVPSSFTCDDLETIEGLAELEDAETAQPLGCWGTVEVEGCAGTAALRETWY